MFCKKCGAELREGATFCMKCGARVTEEEPGQSIQPHMPEQVSDSRSMKQTQSVSANTNGTGKNRLPFILLGIVIVILTGVIIWLTIGRKDTSESANMASEVTTEIQTVQITFDETQIQESVSTEEQAGTQAAIQSEPQTEEIVESQSQTVLTESADDYVENVYAKFGIDMDTIADYSANLNPAEYLFYDSGISDFYFYYPAYLFNYVDYSEEPRENSYGRNLQDILFVSSDGAQLEFQISYRTDNFSLERMTHYVYETALSMTFCSDWNWENTEDDHGEVFVYGLTLDAYDIVYKQIKIESDYVLEMSYTFKYTSEEEYKQRSYIKDCIYYLSGFLGGRSEVPETYEEFMAANYIGF